MSDSLWPHGLQHGQLPIYHCLLEFTQIHVHWVGDVMPIGWHVQLLCLSNCHCYGNLIFCCSLLLLHSVFPSIRVFSNVSALCNRWPNSGASASASVLPMNIQGWFPSGLTGLISLLSKGLSGFFWNRAVCPLVLLDMIYNKKDILHHNTQI